MTRYALVALCSLAVPALAQAGDHEAEEPRASYRLHLGTQVIDLEEGQQEVVEVAGKRLQIRLDASAVRRFEAAGVAFDYPREMVFEYEETKTGLRTWALNGANVVLMVQHFSGLARQTEWTDLLEAYRAEARSMSKSATDRKASLAGRDGPLSGREFMLEIGGQHHSQALFPLRDTSGLVVLWMQDARRDDGSHSEEFARVRSLIERSLRISK